LPGGSERQEINFAGIGWKQNGTILLWADGSLNRASLRTARRALVAYIFFCASANTSVLTLSVAILAELARHTCLET
jgi:hypothetical protein